MPQLIMSVPPWLTYLVIGMLAFGESAAFVGLVLPGESALLLGGVLAGAGRLSLPVVLALAVVAAVAGDSVGYEIGRHGGDAVKSSRAGRFVGEQRWAKAEAFTRKHGNWAVLVGRWVGLMRALVPALAGRPASSWCTGERHRPPPRNGHAGRGAGCSSALPVLFPPVR